MSTRQGAPGGSLLGRTLTVAGCCAAAAVLSACASTEQESARIGRESQAAASQAAKAQHKPSSRARARGHGKTAAHS